MNPDEILALAREAGMPDWNIGIGLNGEVTGPSLSQLFRFAGLVAAMEREACAQVCSAIGQDKWALFKGRAPYTGREDGRASGYVDGQSDGADLCEAAIRARGEKEGA